MPPEKPTPEPAQQLEFQNTIEGVLLHTLGSGLTPELKARFRAEGLDLDKPLLPAYPAKDFHRWVRLAAAAVWPDASEAEALRLYGQRTIIGLEATLLGKAMKATLVLLGPRRGLSQATRAFRTNNNYTEVLVEELSPTALELTFNEVHGLPTYYQGVLEGGGRMMGARNFRVTILDSQGPGAKYRAEWEE